MTREYVTLSRPAPAAPDPLQQAGEAPPSAAAPAPVLGSAPPAAAPYGPPTAVLDRALQLRTGGHTERCHGIRHSGSYSVARHSWGVAMLMHCIWPEHFERLALVCLTHDVPEAWVGDVPAPTKRYSPAIKAEMARLERIRFQALDLPVDDDLPPEDRERVKTCDLLELYLWAVEEVVGGNRHAACVAREVERYAEEVPFPQPAAELYLDVKARFHSGDWRSLEAATDGVVFEMTRGDV